MNASITVVAWSAALAMLAAPLYAADGILIAQKTTSGTSTSSSALQIEKTRMRAEMVDPSGRKRMIVFDGNAHVLRIIDDAAKTYTEITKADIDAISEQMAGAMAMMQQQMANLPPEQRAQMEALMRGRGAALGAAAAATKTEYTKLGTDHV